MAEPAHIPIAKITPPRIGVPLLARGRLHDAVRAALEKKLLLLSAEAGYGKTALLVAALPELDVPVAWVAIDDADADPNLLSAALAAAVHHVMPDVDAPVDELLTVGPSPVDLRRILLRMLEDLPPVVIVLDDFHTVDDSDAVTALVDHLLIHLPPTVHLVIATRTWPRMTVLPRLTVQGEALTIGKERLRFTGEEAAAFLREIHGLTLDDSLAEGLTQRTEGWAAALQLAALASKTQDAPVLAGTPREVFDYLAATVVDALEPGLRDFLQHTSILTEFWPELCRALMPDADVVTYLQEVARRNLFVYRLDDAGTRFRYHQLFAEFLQQRLAARDPDEVKALHRRAARFLEDTNLPDGAVRHYIAGGAYKEAERVMRPLHGDRLTARLAYTFRDLVTRLPSDVLDQYPWMARCGASSARFVGDYRLGLSLAQRALAAAEGRDVDLWTFSIHGVGVMLSHLDRYEEAAAICERAMESLDPSVEPRFRGGVISDLVGAYLALGRIADAARLLPALEEIVLQGTQPGKSYGLAFYAGLVASARMESQRAIDRFTASARVGEERGSPTFELWALLGVLGTEISRRNLPAARETMAKAEKLHAVTGERASELLLTCLRGDVHLLAGDESAAQRAYEDALAALRDTDTQETRLLAQLGLSSIARARGHLGEAETLLDATAQLCERVKLGKLLPRIRFQQISLFLQAGRLEEARRYVTELRALMVAWESPQGVARCDLIEARLQNSTERAAKFLERVLRLNAAGGELIPFLIEEASWAVPLLITALRVRIEPERAVELFVSIGPAAVEHIIPLLNDPALQHQAISILGAIGDPRARRPLWRLARGKNPGLQTLCAQALKRLRMPEAVTLRIRLLGTFEVFRNGERIPDAAWKTQKVRSLLKYLLLHRHRAVAQDEIIDTLWPDANPTAGATNLKTAVKTLRQALEPLLEGTHSSFISREEQTLQFTGNGRCTTDVDEYDRLVSDARLREAAGHPVDAIAILEATVALYRGDLLDEDRYEDWAAMERERRRETHIEVLESLAALHAKRRDYRRAIAAVQQVLVLDRLREAAYRDLMQYTLARGDRQAAIRAYQTCERLLREELGVGPQSETVALYERARTTVPV